MGGGCLLDGIFLGGGGGGGEQIFSWWGETFLHPPSRENPVICICIYRKAKSVNCVEIKRKKYECLNECLFWEELCKILCFLFLVQKYGMQ